MARVGSGRTGATIDVGGVIHRIEIKTVHTNQAGSLRSERNRAAGEFAPRDPAQTDNEPWPHELKLSVQMRAAIGYLGAIGIAIAAARVARIASHKIGDEDVAQARVADHATQQVSRPITAKRNSGAITTEAPGRESDKTYRSRNRTMPRNYA